MVTHQGLGKQQAQKEVIDLTRDEPFEFTLIFVKREDGSREVIDPSKFLVTSLSSSDENDNNSTIYKQIEVIEFMFFVTY